MAYALGFDVRWDQALNAVIMTPRGATDGEFLAGTLVQLSSIRDMGHVEGFDMLPSGFNAIRRGPGAGREVIYRTGGIVSSTSRGRIVFVDGTVEETEVIDISVSVGNLAADIATLEEFLEFNFPNEKTRILAWFSGAEKVPPQWEGDPPMFGGNIPVTEFTSDGVTFGMVVSSTRLSLILHIDIRMN